MKPIEYLLFFCYVFFSVAEENVTMSSTTEAPGDMADPMESRESNITLTLVLANLEEALPTPEPLVGTFPHDFDRTLPRVSRRSYEGMQGQAHSFEEQGAVFVSPGLTRQDLISCARVVRGSQLRGREQRGEGGRGPGPGRRAGAARGRRQGRPRRRLQPRRGGQDRRQGGRGRRCGQAVSRRASLK